MIWIVLINSEIFPDHYTDLASQFLSTKRPRMQAYRKESKL